MAQAQRRHPPQPRGGSSSVPSMASGPRNPRRARSASAPPDGVVVYIHGVGHHEPKAELRQLWDLALFGRGREVEATRMAFWRDIVHPDRPAKKQRQGQTGSTGALDPEEVLRSAGVKPTRQALAFAAGLLGPAGAGTRGTQRKQVMPFPGFIRKPIWRAFLHTFVSDAAAYFFDPQRRERIRARLRAELPTDAATPVTLVAHSLGSVVALEVLDTFASGSRRVVKLVTLGSPLGLREVQDLLEVTKVNDGSFRVPPVVERWHNFADPLDPVAFDKTLEDEFAPGPGEEGTSLVTDSIVINERTRSLWGFNPHSAVGYLAHPQVRRAVHEAAQFDGLARFVVARDVAEELDGEHRVPLLIEVLEPGFPAVGEDQQAREERERRERRQLQPRHKGRAADAGGSEDGMPPLRLGDRIHRAAEDLQALVRERSGPQAVVEARIDELRRFVAAHLTPAEIRELAHRHVEFNLYAVWRSASKKKLVTRSRSVLQVDAAHTSYGARGSGITWAVLDTGVRSDHPHFEKHGNITAVWDCTRGQGPPVKLERHDDRDGHGSHVAGILCGESTLQDGRLVAGMAPETRLVVYKVLDDRGEAEDAWIIKALDHIAEHNDNASGTRAIQGMNLSFGGAYDLSVYGCGFTPICQELRRLWRSGVLVVVACGNEGRMQVQTSAGGVEINTPMSIGDPANLEDCIAVGSVNADRPHLYGVSSFSSRGPTADGRSKPDVVAPGERILSVNHRVVSSHVRDQKSWYREDSGTSMAAPHVSGLLAAFLSVRREFRGRPDEVKRLLLDTCTDLGRDRHHQGRGLPNLMKMLLSV